jgi:hypothetical protein
VLQPLRDAFDQALGRRMRKEEILRELLPGLCQLGYIKTQQMKQASYKAYDVYLLGPQGASALSSSRPIVMPVPAAIRRIEAAEAAKAAARVKELKSGEWAMPDNT